MNTSKYNMYPDQYVFWSQQHKKGSYGIFMNTSGKEIAEYHMKDLKPVKENCALKVTYNSKVLHRVI